MKTTIAGKLTAMAAANLTLLAVVSIIACSVSLGITRTTDGLIDMLHRMERVDQLRFATVESVKMNDFLISGDLDKRTAFELALLAVEEAIRDTEQKGLSLTEKNTIAEIGRQFNLLRDKTNQILEEARTSNRGFLSSNVQGLVEEADEVAGSIVETIEDFHDALKKEIAGAKRGSERVRSLGLAVTGVSLVVAISLGVGGAIVLIRSINRPIKTLARAAKTIAHGNFEERVDITTQDEIGQLAAAFNDMSDTIKRRTDELETANQQLEGEIEERKRIEQEIYEYQERLRSLASGLALAEEHQRRLIAMELHDNAGQELASVLMKLQIIRQTASEGMLASLDDVCGVIRKVVENMRNMTFEICSPTLYKFGLEVAIAELLDDKLGPQDGVSYDFNNNGKAIALSDDIKVVMFQSVRELINNVIKHAQAQHVEVDVGRCEETMKVTVNDDGVGFNPDDLESPERTNHGFGLFSIAERLKYVGGSFEFQSRPGQGSAFTLEAPFQTDTDSLQV